MREKYNTSGKWPVLGEDVMTTNAAGITGDGIVMASEIGADLVDMEQIQLLYLGNPFNGGMTRYTPGTCLVPTKLSSSTRRQALCQEDGRRDVICCALIEQTDGLMYILESGDGDAVDPDELMTETAIRPARPRPRATCSSPTPWRKWPRRSAATTLRCRPLWTPLTKL